MRKRPSRVCNKLCSPGVRRFQLVPCVPARQTPKVFGDGPGLFSPETGKLSYSLLDIGRDSGKNAKESAPSPRAADGLGPRREPPQLLTIFSSFPRVAIHKIGSLYVNPGGGTSPAESCALPGVRVWLGAQELAQEEYQFSIRGMGAPTGQDSTRVGRGGRRIQLCSGLGRVGLGDSSGTLLGIFGRDPSRIIPIVQKSRRLPFFPLDLFS